MTTLTLTIDSVKKERNSSEYRYVPRIRYGEHERSGDGYIVFLFLRDLLVAGIIEETDIVEIYRGETLCFVPTTVKMWVDPPKKKKKEE